MMELVLFTKEQKVEGFMKPTVLNTVLHTTGSLKVILDAELTWREHVKQRISKSYSSL
jgi:hypothetical protein